MSRKLLLLFTIIGMISFPFTFRRKHLKDLLLVYFIKGFISSLIGMIVAKKKLITYPVRLYPHFYKSSIIFDYFLFPLTCVWYNRFSYPSSFSAIIFKALLFSMPMTLLEKWLEIHTKLIKYKKWSAVTTFTTLTSSFLFVRGMMALIRKYAIDD